MRDEELKYLTNDQNAPLPNLSKNLLVLSQIDLSQLLMLQLHSNFFLFFNLPQLRALLKLLVKYGKYTVSVVGQFKKIH